MIPTFVTSNEKAAAVKICDGLNFISTTLPLTPDKDRSDALVHDQIARVHI